MTSKLKCPVCQQELRKLFNRYTGEPNYDYECGNFDCELYGIEIPESVWKAVIQKLEDLKIARNALKEIKKVCDGCRWCDSNLYDPTPSDGRRIAETTNKALEQIEHKEQQDG